MKPLTLEPVAATFTTRRCLGIVIPIVTISIGETRDRYELSPRLTHWGARRVARRELARIDEQNRWDALIHSRLMVLHRQRHPAPVSKEDE